MILYPKKRYPKKTYPKKLGNISQQKISEIARKDIRKQMAAHGSRGSGVRGAALFRSSLNTKPGSENTAAKLIAICLSYPPASTAHIFIIHHQFIIVLIVMFHIRQKDQRPENNTHQSLSTLPAGMSSPARAKREARCEGRCDVTFHIQLRIIYAASRRTIFTLIIALCHSVVCHIFSVGVRCLQHSTKYKFAALQ